MLRLAAARARPLACGSLAAPMSSSSGFPKTFAPLQTPNQDQSTATSSGMGRGAGVRGSTEKVLGTPAGAPAHAGASPVVPGQFDDADEGKPVRRQRRQQPPQSRRRREGISATNLAQQRDNAPVVLRADGTSTATPTRFPFGESRAAAATAGEAAQRVARGAGRGAGALQSFIGDRDLAQPQHLRRRRPQRRFTPRDNDAAAAAEDEAADGAAGSTDGAPVGQRRFDRRRRQPGAGRGGRGDHNAGSERRRVGSTRDIGLDRQRERGGRGGRGGAAGRGGRTRARAKLASGLAGTIGAPVSEHTVSLTSFLNAARDAGASSAQDIAATATTRNDASALHGMLSAVPVDHWAHGFVQSSVAALAHNPSLAAEQKQALLQSTMQLLEEQQTSAE